jgi:hypothetical protein
MNTGPLCAEPVELCRVTEYVVIGSPLSRITFVELGVTLTIQIVAQDTPVAVNVAVPLGGTGSRMFAVTLSVLVPTAAPSVQLGHV